MNRAQRPAEMANDRMSGALVTRTALNGGWPETTAPVVGTETNTLEWREPETTRSTGGRGQ